MSLAEVLSTLVQVWQPIDAAMETRRL